MWHSSFLKPFILISFLVLAISVKSQSFIGAGYGTFNIPGANSQFRGYSPTLKYEYIGNRQRSSGYVELSYFSKTQTDTKYSFIYSRVGYKILFLGDADEKKVLPYLGSGISVVLANSSSNSINNSRTIFGFHFNAGLQYNFKPVILEMEGSMDILLKQLVENSDVSNVMTNIRLSILVPISKL